MKGEYIYTPPVGYSKDQNRRLVPNEDAALIKDIFSQFVKAGSVSEVLDYFKKLPKWRHINFHHQFIHMTLNRRVYLGNL